LASELDRNLSTDIAQDAGHGEPELIHGASLSGGGLST
jgi:hypothetical protein